jgi:hypothetical protein
MLLDRTSDPTVEALSDVFAKTNGIFLMDMCSCWSTSIVSGDQREKLAGCFCLDFGYTVEPRRGESQAREIFLLGGIGVLELETTLHPKPVTV